MDIEKLLIVTAYILQNEKKLIDLAMTVTCWKSFYIRMCVV